MTTTDDQEYSDAFAAGGSEAVWRLIAGRFPSSEERRRELDRLEATGRWGYLQHSAADRAESGLDDAVIWRKDDVEAAR